MKNQEIPKGMEVVTGFQILLQGFPKSFGLSC